MSQIKIPAITHELLFIATHTEEADDIWSGDVKIHPSLKRLSDAVYEQAEKDVEALLDHLKDIIEEGAQGLRIDNWHWPRNEWPWEVYSDIYKGAKGPRKSIGWMGLHVGYGKEGFRLIGFMKPRRGALDRLKNLVRACKNKIEQVHLSREYPKRYPGWNDQMIWFDKKLTLRSSLEELGRQVRTRANSVLSIARPVLE